MACAVQYQGMRYLKVTNRVRWQDSLKFSGVARALRDGTEGNTDFGFVLLLAQSQLRRSWNGWQTRTQYTDSCCCDSG